MSHHEGLKMVLSFAFLCACGIVVPWLYVWLGLMVLGYVWARQTNRPERLVRVAKMASLLLWLLVAILMQGGAVLAINNMFGAPNVFWTSLVALWLMLLVFAVVAELGLLRPVRKNAIAVCEQGVFLPVLQQLKSKWAGYFRE